MIEVINQAEGDGQQQNAEVRLDAGGRHQHHAGHQGGPLSEAEPLGPSPRQPRENGWPGQAQQPEEDAPLCQQRERAQHQGAGRQHADVHLLEPRGAPGGRQRREQASCAEPSRAPTILSAIKSPRFLASSS